jgi:hypothetical protein
MRPDRRLRPTPTRLVAALVGALLGLAAAVPAGAAAADPTPSPSGGDTVTLDPIQSEGGTSDMRQQLNQTQSDWLDAKGELDASIAHQQELIVTLEKVKVQLGVQTEELGKVANAAYVSAGEAGVIAIMSTGSAKQFLDGVGLVDALATRQANIIDQLLATRAAANDAQAGIDAEVARQKSLEQVMFDRNQQAELALCRAAVGNCDSASDGGFSARASFVADPAPRNPDGSFPPEYIPHDRAGYPAVVESTVTGNPYATGYITPRTAHAVTQAKKAGFNIFVECYSPGEDGGQHPRGRACDFAVDPNCTYCNAATGANRTYGDDLADFFVFNAERLGVLYVIWYQRIWLASTGRWKPYTGGHGDPSSNHTNHVHVSIR